MLTPVVALLVLAVVAFCVCAASIHSIHSCSRPSSVVTPQHVVHHGNVTTSKRQAPPPDRPYVPSRRCAEFHQVGFVYDTDRGMKAPLYGRPAPRNPSRWQYYLRTDDVDVRVRVNVKGRSSMEDTGCEELQTGDVVSAPELLHGDVKVHVYDVHA